VLHRLKWRNYGTRQSGLSGLVGCCVDLAYFKIRPVTEVASLFIPIPAWMNSSAIHFFHWDAAFPHPFLASWLRCVPSVSFYVPLGSYIIVFGWLAGPRNDLFFYIFFEKVVLFIII
jgi:hypothetical protein